MKRSDGDPAPVDWGAARLPASWADEIGFDRPSGWWRLAGHVLARRRRRVQLPADLPGAGQIPAYVLQEFHNLPNGFYSHRISRGYSRAFDTSMLGTLRAGRARLAAALGDCGAALDLGCGAGHGALALAAAGIPEVWGLDPCPYLLQLASRRSASVHWTQGLAEDLPFEDGRFDGVVACFVFHELPPRFADRALAEIRRVLRPGGRFALLEPAAEQRRLGAWALARRYGWRGVYFKALAGFVHEPFIDAWHARPLAAWLGEHGFELLADEEGCPLRFTLARSDGPPTRRVDQPE